MEERFQDHSTNSKKHFTLRVDSFERKFEERILIVYKRSVFFIKKVIKKKPLNNYVVYRIIIHLYKEINIHSVEKLKLML